MSKNISDISFKEAISERYLAYALSTIKSRSLPDVRDGLKPVHRRLLYAMMQLKLEPKSGFKKCARVVGDVIGKYHPHGDTAVYDAMVRLAQEFAVRYPLVEGQGNFGSVDGDNAAAMRYTESRLTGVAIELLKDIDQNTVDFNPTYDSSDEEPKVLPAYFPNLLANGSEGIAVGMATCIPPHNVGEICMALQKLIENPQVEIKELLKSVKGPDFPTGGEIIENKENILAAYTNGRGSIRIRAKWKKEALPRGMYQIVVTQIPYQVQKSRLIEKIADNYKDKKLPMLGNVRDESAEDIRIVLEPKNKNVAPEVLMESLFKITDLESRFNMNLNVINSRNVPKVLNLKEILQEFLDHQMVVLKRKTNFRLEKIAARLEILAGLLIAYLNIDEVIKIIREEDNARQIMMKRFSLTENQAEAILNMRLRSLRKLEEIEIKKEHKELEKEQKKLQVMLSSEKKCWDQISRNISEIDEKFGRKTQAGKRRTSFGDAPSADVVSIEAFIEKEPITVLCSQKGWIRAFKGHHDELPDAKYKEGDRQRFLIKAQTTDKLLIFCEDGKFYTLACDKIPGARGDGESIRVMFDIPADIEFVDLHIFQPEEKFLLASDIGKGFVVKSGDVIAMTKNGKSILGLPATAKAKICTPVEGDHIAVMGSNRKMLVFKLDEIPEMKKGQGVFLQKYKNAKLSDLRVFKLEEGLSFGKKHLKDVSGWVGKRASMGKLPPDGFPRNNKF